MAQLKAYVMNQYTPTNPFSTALYELASLVKNLDGILHIAIYDTILGSTEQSRWMVAKMVPRHTLEEELRAKLPPKEEDIVILQFVADVQIVVNTNTNDKTALVYQSQWYTTKTLAGIPAPKLLQGIKGKLEAFLTGQCSLEVTRKPGNGFAVGVAT